MTPVIVWLAGWFLFACYGAWRAADPALRNGSARIDEAAKHVFMGVMWPVVIPGLAVVWCVRSLFDELVKFRMRKIAESKAASAQIGSYRKSPTCPECGK